MSTIVTAFRGLRDDGCSGELGTFPPGGRRVSGYGSVRGRLLRDRSRNRFVITCGIDPAASPGESVSAPAGYGKTTLLTQWADADDRPFAWVSLDADDIEPRLFLAYLTEALDRVEPIGRHVFDALGGTTTSIPRTAVPRLAAAFRSMTTPVVLVIDNAHVLEDPACHDALAVIADHVPPGSRLVLCGRSTPPSGSRGYGRRRG